MSNGFTEVILTNIRRVESRIGELIIHILRFIKTPVEYRPALLGG
jgi:hypothetical protein